MQLGEKLPRQEHFDSADCLCMLQAILEMAEQENTTLDGALAAPALALALREYPANTPAVPATVADADLQRTVLRGIRCERWCCLGMYWVDFACAGIWWVGYGLLSLGSWVVLEGYTPEGPPVQKFACGQADKRGFGNSFQPAIVASRFDLINCDIAPSAKMLGEITPLPGAARNPLWGGTPYGLRFGAGVVCTSQMAAMDVRH